MNSFDSMSKRFKNRFIQELEACGNSAAVLLKQNQAKELANLFKMYVT